MNILITFLLLISFIISQSSTLEAQFQLFIDLHRQQHNLFISQFPQTSTPTPNNSIPLFIYNSYQYLQLCYSQNISNNNQQILANKLIPKLFQVRSYAPLSTKLLHNNPQDISIKCYNIMNKLQLLQPPDYQQPTNELQQSRDISKISRNKIKQYLSQQYQFISWKYLLVKSVNELLQNQQYIVYADNSKQQNRNKTLHYHRHHNNTDIKYQTNKTQTNQAMNTNQTTTSTNNNYPNTTSFTHEIKNVTTSRQKKQQYNSQYVRTISEIMELPLFKFRKFGIVVTLTLQQNNVNAASNKTSIHLVQYYQDAQSINSSQTSNKISKKLEGKGFHQHVIYTINYNNTQHLQTYNLYSGWLVYIKQVLPHNVYIDCDEIKSLGIKVELNQLNAKNGRIEYINIEQPAYLEKQHQYQLIIPLQLWNHTYVDELTINIPIHFRYNFPYSLQPKRDTRQSKSALVPQFTQIDLYPIQNSYVSYNKGKEQIVIKLKEDYLVSKGTANIPVGDGSMKFIVNAITVVSEVLCAAILVKYIKK